MILYNSENKTTIKIELHEDIPAGHKFALKNIPQNSVVIKYGYPIGYASADIILGQWVNEKNLRTNLEGMLDYKYIPNIFLSDIRNRNLSFKGFRRSNGKAGVRNEIWIIPTVGCVNGTANTLAEKLRSIYAVVSNQ